MKQSNRTILGLAAASLLAAGAATAVAAGVGGAGGYPGMMGGPGPMMGTGPGGMMGSVSDTTAQLGRIKGELGITQAQEAGWKAYAQAATNQSALMNAHRQTMWSGATPPAIDQRATMRQQGARTMQQTSQAAQDLYQVLTPSQRAKAGGLIPFLPGRGMATYGR